MAQTSAPFDLVIRNGQVVDGSGEPSFVADIGVRAGKIAEIGAISARGAEEIDATDCVVTPGFVDPHTHYDGQAIWSDRMSPSSLHGVTTVACGNCGVGFAPCRPEDRELLISAMEGVEDIPEIVMTEGLTWDWESFPEFLQAMERRSRDIDVAAYLPHSALRVYVMGERGAAREPASEADLEKMQAVAREALAAGAVGFATSSIYLHRRSDGAPIPSYQADAKELRAMAAAIREAGHGLFQMVADLGEDDGRDPSHTAVEMLSALSADFGVPATFSLAQTMRSPQRWRTVMDMVEKSGGALRPQVFPRPIGMILGHNLSNNPFAMCPSYAPLVDLPMRERVARLRDPELRERLINETPGDPTYPLIALGRMFDRMFEMEDPPDYEPPLSESVAARAARMGVSPQALAYDLLLKDDGEAMLYVAFANYAEGNLDFLADLLQRPDAVLGLGDGGAHYGLICDASFPTFLLSHWTRDRQGQRIGLEKAVAMLAAKPAKLLGLSDRGALRPGLRADINVIDYKALRLRKPEVRHDLPKGGRRLVQAAKGFRATLVNGEAILRDDVPTDALPGKVIRAGAAA